MRSSRDVSRSYTLEMLLCLAEFVVGARSFVEFLSWLVVDVRGLG